MLLSVCIPTFNRCAFIRLSARYWLEQLPPFAHQVEFIIADNASTDETSEVLESYRGLGSFQLIRRTQHLTFNETTYDLVAVRARGEYVWVCGDDDYPSPTALAKVVTALQAHREQDHFYVTTQFVPSDYAPDVGREDPRQSAYIHSPAGDLSSGVVPRTQKILEFDGGGFSGFYSSIWRRPLAVEALSGDFCCQAPFTSLEATLPYAVYIARHRLKKSCYRIGPPLLTVVHTIAWAQHASFFRLKTMPDLYDL
jgi:glycosyltransferase involved in cell wall biosynthesis